MIESNFLEVETVEEANAVNMEVYTFIGFSPSRDKYIFKRRERKR